MAPFQACPVQGTRGGLTPAFCLEIKALQESPSHLAERFLTPPKYLPGRTETLTAPCLDLHSGREAPILKVCEGGSGLNGIPLQRLRR
jgi:hypothetical protein